MSKKTTQWETVLATVLAQPEFRNILLMGPPGTGKSTFPVRHFGRDAVVRVSCTDGMERADFIGSMGMVDGTTRHIDGPAAIAMREGKCLVLDEADRVPPELQSLMQAILDHKEISEVRDSHGQPIVPAEGFRVILTTNAEDPLTAFPQPIFDRLQIVVPCIAPCREAMEALPETIRPMVANHYRNLSGWKWAAPISYRRALTFQMLMDCIDVETAGRLVFGELGAEVVSAVVTAQNQHKGDA